LKTIEEGKLVKTEKQYSVFLVKLSEEMSGNKFPTFSAMRKESNKVIGKVRNRWIKKVLKGHNIDISKGMTKKDRNELFEKNNIRIVREDGFDKVYLEDKIIGEWSNSKEIEFLKDNIVVKIKYFEG
jgi:hypothetical protein